MTPKSTSYPLQLVVRRGDSRVSQGCVDEAGVCRAIRHVATAFRDRKVPPDAVWTVEPPDAE